MSIIPAKKQNNSRFTLFTGLGRTLFISLLLFSLLPLGVVGLLSYKRGQTIRFEKQTKSLEAGVNLRTLYLESYFQERINDLILHADFSENIILLQNLQAAFSKSGLPLEQFTKTYKYLTVATEHGEDIQEFQELSEDYHDILLIDPQGNIIHSVAAEVNLGTNIFTGPYRNTALSRVARKTIDWGQTLCSDLTVHDSSGNRESLFVSQVMVDEDGEMIGVMVIQITMDHINSIMTNVDGLGETGQIFLVGVDSALRSRLRNGGTKSVSGVTIESPLITQWLSREKIRHGSDTGHDKGLLPVLSEIAFYQGQSHKQTLALSRDVESLHVYGLHWLMIAEIDEAEAFAASRDLGRMILFTLIITTVLVFFLAVFITRRMVLPLSTITVWSRKVAQGDLEVQPIKTQDNEIGTLYQAMIEMVASLKKMMRQKDQQDWLKSGEAGLNRSMQGGQDLVSLGQNVINYLGAYLDVPVGAFFAMDDEILHLVAGYAFRAEESGQKKFALGEGLVGQAALEKKSIIFKKIPTDHLNLKISSGLGLSSPQEIMALPLVHENKVLGVLVFGCSSSFVEQEIALLEHIARSVAVAVNSANQRQQMQTLLLETQNQKEELQTREEELTANNEELEEANRELEKNSAELEEQGSQLEEQANHLKKQQKDLEERNKKIEQANRYKSEFLANMSHELRTPLNSILLLSNLMAANKKKQLSDDDVESAQTINKSGKDLLNLINEVLDLAKVESGRVDVLCEKVLLKSVCKHMEQLFRPICVDKGLEFVTILDEALPESIATDQQRLEQILKNLLSNSCKFTESGRVTLRISRTDTLEPELIGMMPESLAAKAGLAFTVIDSGIGIANDRHDIVFEAFKQADGSTSRKFGGTGLGLSISREMAGLLGGDIVMISSPGKGSTFTLCLPEQTEVVKVVEKKEEFAEEKSTSGKILSSPSAATKDAPDDFVVDDRNTIHDDDKVLLIIDDDPSFAAIVRDMAREQQFKVLVAETGETGLQYADLYRPMAIILDLGLPGMDGWSVLSRLKESSATRHIPVHVISASDRDTEVLRMGALNFLTKPVDAATLNKSLTELLDVAGAEIKKLLLVEDEDSLSEFIKLIFKADDIELFRASTGSQAIAILTAEHPDCVILDLGLPDMAGEKVLEYIRDQEDLCRTPVIVYTGKELSPKEQGLIDQFSQSTLLKGASSHERLLAQATLFMHRVEKNLPLRQREIMKQFYNREEIFKDKKILLVDDDMRNVFSLRKILNDKSMAVVVGKNGKEALEQLENNPDIDLVLMDIMMPVMDGFEAMAEIRKQEKFAKLPVVALTAKAMKGDRKKCIDAGANDYLAKPIDPERLFSMLRVWLYG